MSRSLNKIQIIGYVSKDPEVRETSNGNKVCTLSIPTNRYNEETDWHTVVMWGKLAEICEDWVRKGMRLYIEGEMQYRKWEDKEGNKRTMAEIKANQMLMLDSKAQGKSGQQKLVDVPKKKRNPLDDVSFD